jgi:hypothetical protein
MVNVFFPLSIMMCHAFIKDKSIMPTPMDLALGSLEEDIAPTQDQVNPTNHHDNNKINKFE